MAESMPLDEMSTDHQSMFRRAASRRERITIVDHDEPSAVVVSADELEDLEDALAVAQSRLREARGEGAWVTNDEVKHRLGIEQ